MFTFTFTPFELATTCIAVFAAIIGLVNFIWLVFNHRPRFHLYHYIGRFFTGTWTTTDMVTPETKTSTFVEVMVDVRNASDRDNSIVEFSFSCDLDRALVAIPNSPIVIGSKEVLPLWQGMDKKRDIYWERPEQLWSEIVPCFLPAGAHIVLPVCYRLRGAVDITSEFGTKVKVTVRDSFNKTYSKTIPLTRLSSGKIPYELGVPGRSTEGYDSIEKV